MLRVGWFFLVILPGPTDGGVYEITYLMPEDTESSKHGEQNILIRTSKSLRLNRHHWQPGCHHLGMRSVCPKHDYPFSLLPSTPYPLTLCILTIACSHTDGHFFPLMDQSHEDHGLLSSFSCASLESS